MGVNAASNAPRMLTSLAEAYRRGAQIVHVNPFIEVASTRTIVPHEIPRMATFQSTRIGTLNIQPRIAGDMALMRGVAKHLLEASRTDPDAIDRQFIDRYTAGFDAYKAILYAVSWGELELQSGMLQGQIRALGEIIGSPALPSSAGALASRNRNTAWTPFGKCEGRFQTRCARLSCDHCFPKEAAGLMLAPHPDE